MPSLLIAAGWAGLLSLDFIGIGPFLISQPIVCGPLFGMLMGDLAAGLLIGAIVQLLWMDVTPVGVGIPYDLTATTLLAVYWASQPAVASQPGFQGSASVSQIVLALVIAVPFGLIFRWVDQFARRLNSRLIHAIDTVPDARLPLALQGAIAGGLGLIFVRYFVCYALALWAGEWIWKQIAYTPRMTPVDRGLTMAALLLPLAGLGVCLELLMSDEPGRRWDPLRGFLGGRRKEHS